MIYFAGAQDTLNLRILRVLEGNFSLDAAYFLIVFDMLNVNRMRVASMWLCCPATLKIWIDCMWTDNR